MIVVGAGITGVAASEWLRRDGWRVAIVDPLTPGERGQTSYGNAGLLARTSIVPVGTPAAVRHAPAMLFDKDAPLFMRWAYLPRLLPWLVPFMRNATEARVRAIAAELSVLTHDTTEQHLALAAGTGAERYIRQGILLNLYRDRAAYDADRLGQEIRKSLGIDLPPLDRAAILERDPNVGPAYTFATLVEDYAWITSPGSYVGALFAHLMANGVTHHKAKAVDIAPGERPSVTLEGGTRLEADKVVLSSGAWSAGLAKVAGVPVKLEAERGYHVRIDDPAIMPPQPMMLTDAKVVLTPMEGMLRAAGIAEFGGLDGPESKAPIGLITRAIKRAYPSLEFEISDTWMGRRPTTPDSLPLLGHAPAAPNVVFATGGQHVGLTMSAKVGRLVSTLAAGQTPNIDLSAFRPDRF